MSDDCAGYVLVSQVFPPAVGGSGVLLENVYSRVRNGHVTVLVDEGTCGRPTHSGLSIVPTTVSPHAWGIFSPAAWPHHIGLAHQVYQRSHDGRAVVHCGRAQPEGIAAYLASQMPGGSPYVFWAHGEDISAALSSRQFAWTMRLVYGRAAAAIANSRNTAGLLKQTGWYRGTVHVVYPGVDASRFTPCADDGSLRRSLTGENEIVLLSVARLQRRKGHDLVLRALPELLRRFRVRYVIVGDGPERESLRRLAGSLNVEQSVSFTGEVNAADLPAYFAAADIFVLPTRFEPPDFEGFGIVFLEAAAAGKPTVGGRNGGVPEAVADGLTGFLVEGDDVEDLTSALTRLCESDSLRAVMGEAGRRRASEEFTWDVAAAAIEDIQNQVKAGWWSLRERR